jgi:hypothetical protein
MVEEQRLNQPHRLGFAHYRPVGREPAAPGTVQPRCWRHWLGLWMLMPSRLPPRKRTRTRTLPADLSLEAEQSMQVEAGLEIRSELGLVLEFRSRPGSRDCSR